MCGRFAGLPLNRAMFWSCPRDGAEHTGGRAFARLGMWIDGFADGLNRATATAVKRHRNWTRWRHWKLPLPRAVSLTGLARAGIGAWHGAGGQPLDGLGHGNAMGMSPGERLR